MTTRPPLSNLGPQSEPWARWQTDQTLTNAQAIERLGGDASNDGRINNSQMDLMASQLNELYQRQSGLILVDDASTPAFSSGTRSVTRNVVIPPPSDVPRIGWLTVQFTATVNNTRQTEIYGSFSVNGNVFHRDSRAVPSANVEPPSWAGQKAIAGYSGFTSSAGGSNVSIVMEAEAAFSSGSRVATFRDIQVTYQYGQRL